MADEESLQAGWERDTPAGDTVLRDYLVAWARWLEGLAATSNGRWERHDDVVLSDLASPNAFGNTALLLRPLDADRVDDLVARLDAFFRTGVRGGYVVFSAWPTPRLHPAGFELGGHPPFMLRPAGGEARPAPPGLRIEEVRDPGLVAAWNRALVLGFPLPEIGDGELFGAGVLDVDGARLWVGFDGDEPVATAAGHVDGRLQHVEMISTRPEWRGRGYGEALTWRATLADPRLPAALLASGAGRPVYERMGYLPLTRFTLWFGARGGS